MGWPRAASNDNSFQAPSPNGTVDQQLAEHQNVDGPPRR
jgi:hypothetical protein